MNLVEALRTGLPLRRPISRHMNQGRTGWLGSQYVLLYLTSTSSATLFPPGTTVQLINEDDILANDWVVKEDDDIIHSRQ